MAKNSARREALLDAGLNVLATRGARGLTHRAVDAEAGVPTGTCVNYLRTKDALYDALGQRIFERLTPSPQWMTDSAAVEPSVDRLVTLMHQLLARVRAQPLLQVALLELRLEATRRPPLEAALTSTLRDALAVDLAFHREARLPGGRQEIVMLHLAIGGLILNLVTLPGVLEIEDPTPLVDAMVTRLLAPIDAQPERS